jgi:hypothetical protein
MPIAQIINQNSYVVMASVLTLAAFLFVLFRFRTAPLAWGGLVVLMVVLVAINLALRVNVSEIETTAQFDQLLKSNQPVVLEIYSNY